MLTSELVLPKPVLVLEDDPTMQQRLSQLLFSIGYNAKDLHFSQTIAHAKIIFNQQSIAFCLVDLGLPDGHGRELIEYIRLTHIDIPILVISAWSTQNDVLTAIQAGATGYLLKERDDFEITLSLRSILKGGAPIDPFIAKQILAQVSYQLPKVLSVSPDFSLSLRELEILKLVADGLSNKAIAQSIHLSRHTVDSHIQHIYRKLAVCTRTTAISTAQSLGLL